MRSIGFIVTMIGLIAAVGTTISVLIQLGIIENKKNTKPNNADQRIDSTLSGRVRDLEEMKTSLEDMKRELDDRKKELDKKEEDIERKKRKSTYNPFIPVPRESKRFETKFTMSEYFDLVRMTALNRTQLEELDIIEGYMMMKESTLYYDGLYTKTEWQTIFRKLIQQSLLERFPRW